MPINISSFLRLPDEEEKRRREEERRQKIEAAKQRLLLIKRQLQERVEPAIGEFISKRVEPVTKYIPRREEIPAFRKGVTRWFKDLITPLKSVVRKVGEFEAPFTEKEGFFITEQEPVPGVPVKEFVRPKSYVGGPVGKGLASMVRTGVMATLPMTAGTPAAVTKVAGAKLSPVGAAKGASVLAGFDTLLRKMEGEEVTPASIATSGLIGAFFGVVQPKPLSGIPKTKLANARKILGVKPTATPQELKTAYYNLAKKTHPDVGGSPEAMANINQAFEYLTSVKPKPTLKFSDIGSWLSGLWKAKPKPTGKEMLQLRDSAVNLVKEAVKSGDIKAAKAIYTQSAKNIKLPKFEEIKKMVEPEVVSPPTGYVTAKGIPKELKSLAKKSKSVEEFVSRIAKPKFTEVPKDIQEQVIKNELKKGIAETGGEANLRQIAEGFRVNLDTKTLDITGLDPRFGTIKEATDFYNQAVGKKPAIKVKPKISIRPQAEISIKEFVPQEKPVKKVTTVKQLEKQQRAERFDSYLDAAKTQKDFVKRVDILTKQLDKPKIAARHPVLKQTRARVVKRIENLTGVKGLGRNWKQDYSLLQLARQDPEIADSVEALENYIYRLDEVIGKDKKVRKVYEMAVDEGLPVKGKFFIPYGKYSTKGTRNREWVRENIPLLHMGNKWGMMGYILDSLGVKQKDLGSLATEDVSHLKFDEVYDLFGGSGLLSSVSKKLFPGAKITYNELGEGTLTAIEKAKKEPKKIQKFVSEVAVWLKKNPRADWLSHFSAVYKDNEDFLTAARLIEASTGRGEMTPLKLRNVIKAIPNFSKTFRGIKTTSEDALKLIDKFIKSGTSKDFLWIDPPYLWSTGYGVGTEMEKATGFRKLLGQLEKLNERGVRFMFFNNDPEVQVEKADTESVHLKNIMGQINKLSEKMIVVRGIKPIGAAKRREILITNLEYGKDIGRLLNLEETRKAIEALKDDPATAPREVLKMFRELRGTTELVPQAKRITAHQIRTIRTLRSRLRIKNRELLPVMNELLDEMSFAKMTLEDGKRMISWLQPRNWEIIEDHIARTRKELFEGRREKLIGEKFVAKYSELEEKFGVIAALNKTAEEIQNITEVIGNLPPLEKDNSSTFRDFLKWTSPYVSEDLGAKLVGIKQGFHTPMRAIINVSKKHTNRMKKTLTEVFKDLSKTERKQVIMIQAGAPSFTKRAASKKAQHVAKYIQDVAEKNIQLINRLRVAINKPPLKSRKPYIPYIIDESISQAADLFDKNKFWEQRTKTFKEFQAGLFTHDPQRIIEIWTESSGSWLKKNLFSALLLDRYQNLYNVSGPAAAYGRTIVELDIYNMMPARERLFRSIGEAVNKRMGGIFPKKIPIDPDLAAAIENTTFGKELMADVSKGYLRVPRVKLPNAGDVFHKVFYPAKLAWNFSFALINRQQPFAAIPFTGITSVLAGRVKMYSMIFPWNKIHRERYVKILEESGYQYGRYVAGQELKPIKGKIGKSVDRGVNFVGDITEIMNRLETEIGTEHFLNLAEGRIGQKLSQADKDKIMGTMSAFIHFLSGKGYAPPAQRSMVGRFLYTFQQYPINQINVFTEMYKVAMKDNGVREFWKMMAKEGGASQEAQDFFNKLPNGSKARVFSVFLSIVLPVAIVYGLSRSWNVASRALPGLPRIAFGDLAAAVSDFIENPEKNKDAFINATKKFFAVTAKKRLEDALNIAETGILQKGFSKKPIFVDRSIDSIAKVFFFGRSALPEYEKQFPSILGRFFGGRTEAGRVKELKTERGRLRKEETETAVEFMRGYTKAKTPEEKRALFKEYAEGGRFTEGVIKKLKQFYKERATGVGGLERSIVNLKDEDQARFILEQFNKTKDVDEKKELMIRYKNQGILTKNVIAEMKKLIQEESFKKGFFGL